MQCPGVCSHHGRRWLRRCRDRQSGPAYELPDLAQDRTRIADHGPAQLLALGGAGLAVSVRRGGLLTVLIAMPFYVPVLIFGAAASQAALSDGASIWPYLGILAALSAATILLAPFAIAAALRAAQD